jgi:hypothetical protein
MCLVTHKMCSDRVLAVYEKKGLTRPSLYKRGTISAVMDEHYMSRWYPTMNMFTLILSGLGLVFTWVTLVLWLTLCRPMGWVAMTLYGAITIICIFFTSVALRTQDWS